MSNIYKTNIFKTNSHKINEFNKILKIKKIKRPVSNGIWQKAKLPIPNETGRF